MNKEKREREGWGVRWRERREGGEKESKEKGEITRPLNTKL